LGEEDPAVEVVQSDSAASLTTVGVALPFLSPAAAAFEPESAAGPAGLVCFAVPPGGEAAEVPPPPLLENPRFGCPERKRKRRRKKKRRRKRKRRRRRRRR
jgi:hypothetical protein